MENTPLLKEIRQIYDDYLTVTASLAAERKSADGLLGMGKGPGCDSSHDHFVERIEQTFASLTASSLSSKKVLKLLQFMYNAPLAHQNNMLAYWMLLAVHALTEKFIPLLSPEDAAILFAQYTGAYPKYVRLPAQKKIVAQLQAQTGSSKSR
ncbi:MAG TPA: hypothetical protein VN626_01245 [Clostridia bacterium]|nr:hypothetical protein [Clostridia bacterium]